MNPGSASRISTAFLALLLAASGGPFVSGARAAEPGLFEKVGQEVNEIFVRCNPSVVKVKSFVIDPDIAPKGTNLEATGFFIDDQGTLLTTFSVVLQSQQVWVEIDGKRHEATILGADPRSRLAFLKVNTKSKPLEFADSSRLHVGGAVMSIGFPYNLPSTPNFGFIGGFDTQYKENFFVTTHIRANLPISPGQAGSPLLTPEGKVVGMLVAGMEDGKACYAIPSNAIRKIQDDIKKFNGIAKHAWVGVGVVKTNVVADGRSVVIRQVSPGTPAEKSDLKTGDVVLKIGSFDIYNPSDVLDASFYAKVGEPVTVTVLRDGRKVDTTLVFTPRPATSQSVEKIPALGPQPFEKVQMGSSQP